MKHKNLLTTERLTLLGLLLGVGVGFGFPEVAQRFSILGDIFLNLLKAMILPVIMVSIFLALSKTKSGLAELSKKTLGYFFMTSALACVTGLVVAKLILVKPQAALSFKNFDATQVKEILPSDFILSFISSNPFKSLVDGQILPIVVFTMAIGLAATRLPSLERERITGLADAIHSLVMVVMTWILKIAPIGVFALTASMVVGLRGMDLAVLTNFFLAVSIAAGIHVFITLPLIATRLGKFSPYRFILQVKEALVVALGTASSTATLPVSTRVLETQGVDSKVTGFVLPLGATLNMNGSALYQALVVLFLGHVAGVDFSFLQQIFIFLFVMVSAAGTAGIPGGGLMMMTATLQALGLPVELIGLYLLVDRFWDPPITMINVLDDLFAAKTIDRWLKR